MHAFQTTVELDNALPSFHFSNLFILLFTWCHVLCTGGHRPSADVQLSVTEGERAVAFLTHRKEC